jgi:hypothetical protein
VRNVRPGAIRGRYRVGFKDCGEEPEDESAQRFADDEGSGGLAEGIKMEGNEGDVQAWILSRDLLGYIFDLTCPSNVAICS